MENGVGAWSPSVGSVIVRMTAVIGKVKLEPDETKDWGEKACPPGGFHVMWQGGDGGRSHLYPAGIWGRNIPLCLTFMLHPLPPTTICVLKAIAINGDRNSYESLIFCQLVN